MRLLVYGTFPWKSPCALAGFWPVCKPRERQGATRVGYSESAKQMAAPALPPDDKQGDAHPPRENTSELPPIAGGVVEG